VIELGIHGSLARKKGDGGPDPSNDEIFLYRGTGAAPRWSWGRKTEENWPSHQFFPRNEND